MIRFKVNNNPFENLFGKKQSTERTVDSFINLMRSPFGTMKPFFLYKNNKRFIKLIDMIGQYLTSIKQLEKIKKSKETNISARIKVSTELSDVIRKRLAISMETFLGIERNKFDFSVTESVECYVISFSQLEVSKE